MAGVSLDTSTCRPVTTSQSPTSGVRTHGGTDRRGFEVQDERPAVAGAFETLTVPLSSVDSTCRPSRLNVTALTLARW